MCVATAVQNERDRISVRRTTYDDIGQNGSLSVHTLLNAELLSRQVQQCTHSLHPYCPRQKGIALWVSAMLQIVYKFARSNLDLMVSLQRKII